MLGSKKRENFRKGVCVAILHPHEPKVLWLHRADVDAWQFCGGGVDAGESDEEAMWRELHEEVNLTRNEVELIASSDKRIKYRLPEEAKKKFRRPDISGQKQRWYLLKAKDLEATENSLKFDNHRPIEFQDWRWVPYWYPLSQIVSFKREAYRKGLLALAEGLDSLE